MDENRLTLLFDPANKVADGMTASEMARSPVVPEIIGERVSESPVDKRVTFSLIFNTVRIPRLFGKADCYVACQGALIRFSSDRANVTGGTQAATVEFTFTTTSTRTGKAGIELAPEVEGKAGPVSAKAKGPKADFSNEKGRSHTISYTASENKLAVAISERSASWKISMERSEHGISDVLFGNVPLAVDFKSNGDALGGQLTIDPKVFRFDKDERRIEGKANILLTWEISRAGVLNDKRTLVQVKEIAKK